MIQIDDTLVSLDLIERSFLCDLSHCKGQCCVEGDSGAPLEPGEEEELKRVLPEIWNDLLPEARTVIQSQGVAYTESPRLLATRIVSSPVTIQTVCVNAPLRRPTGKDVSPSTNRSLAISTPYVSPNTKRFRRSITTVGMSAKQQNYWERKNRFQSISF